MKLNVDKYHEMIQKNGMTEEYVKRAAGLSARSYNWIMENGFIEVETLERIADAVGCEVEKLSLPDSTMVDENCIEWIKNEDRATLTLSQRRTITKVEKLAAEHPDECKIIVRNPDGSIMAHVPVRWIKISPLREVSEERREMARELMKNMHTNSLNADYNPDENE